MKKITKEQVKSFLSDKESFEENNIIFYIEYDDPKTYGKGGIAFHFDNFGILIDIYGWKE